MSSKYQRLLEETASLTALSPERLLAIEELEIDGTVIGLAYHGDDQSGDIQLFAEVGPLSRQEPIACMRDLLEANHLGAGAGGCALGVRPDSNAVLLWGRFPIERLDGESLITLLGQFADVAGFWRARLQPPARSGRATVVTAMGA